MSTPARSGRREPQPVLLAPLIGREQDGATTLPAPLTRLIGRERELASILSLLGQQDVRLVTLTGPGGVGKTHLALEMAAGLRDGYADGVWFIPLSAVTDPDLVAPTIAQAIGLRVAVDALLPARL